MTGGYAERIEAGADAAAAALLGAATAVVLYHAGAVEAYSAAGAAIAFACAFQGLRTLEFDERLQLPAFEPRTLDVENPPELVLTDEDRLDSAPSDADELLLDNVLAGTGTDGRVVRLFDPGASHAPGQLSDASQALYEALAELRRSLR